MSRRNNNNWKQNLQDRKDQEQYYEEEQAKEVFIREKYKESGIRSTRWTNVEDPVKYEHVSESLSSGFQEQIKRKVDSGELTITNKTKWSRLSDKEGWGESETMVIEDRKSKKTHLTLNSCDDSLSGAHVTYKESRRKQHNIGLEDPDLIDKMKNYGASRDDIKFAKGLQRTLDKCERSEEEKKEKEKRMKDRLDEWYESQTETPYYQK